MITERPLAANLTPNDTAFIDQWHYRYAPGDNFDDATEEGLNLLPAWNISTGAPSTVVAVLDTGIRPHADLTGRFTGGYDFVSNVSMGNDGNGRDADPSDPGDWMPTGVCGSGFPPSPIDSSWHGTHVAGTIGAASNNNSAVAGVDWKAKIVPVRVLGRCGGTDSDINDAIRWAAGLSVPGAPANPNPADVMNLSLGGQGACDSFTQSAVNDAVTAGTVVVVAAGNSGDNAGGYSPASCSGVITVAATTKYGDASYYSNYGATIEVSAPGGETSFFESEGVLSTLNAGATVPGADSLAFYQGTSMAAPHVAGVASLMKGLNPSQTPAQVSNILETTARDFPSYAGCDTANCGEGIVDAFEALEAVQPPPPLDFMSYIPISLDVGAAPPPPPASLVNGAFEQGSGVGWTESSSNGFQLVLDDFEGGGGQQVITPHSGSWAAWLGGWENETSILSQQITVNAGSPFLTYYHVIGSEETTCGNDVAGVDINGATVKSYNLCDGTNTGDWVKQSINVAAYAGQTVLLEFWAQTNGNAENSNWFLDDVAFAASAAAASQGSGPAGADASAPRAAE
jgi:subtilisin family serine protease